MPGFGCDILAEPRLLAAGCTIGKTNTNMKVTHGDKVVFEVSKPPTQSLFYLEARPSKCKNNTPTNSEETVSVALETVNVARSYADCDPLLLDHLRMGHRNFQRVAKIAGHKMPKNIPFCKTCVTSKSTRHPIGGSADRSLGDAPRPGYLFHADTIPFRHATRNGEKYALLLVDDYSRAIFVILLKLLSETVEAIKDFIALVESKFARDKVVAQLRTDSASYFATSATLAAFCKRKGIYQVHSPPYTQALNGVAERHVRTLLDMTRALMIHAGAPTNLWGFAIKQAVKICNRFFNRSSCEPTTVDHPPGRHQTNTLPP